MKGKKSVKSKSRLLFSLLLFVFALCLLIVIKLVYEIQQIEVVEPDDPTTWPTAPATMPELIESLSSPDIGARLTAIIALGEMGPDAEPAVPALIAALSDEVDQVQMEAAETLGEIGPGASPAVLQLIELLKFEENIHTRFSVAMALGKIGDERAVPALAEILWDQRAYEHSMQVPIGAAWAIAQITNNPFSDSEPDNLGYTTNEEGEALIVLAAKAWWEEFGQYQEWPPLEDE